jgi:transcriptional regulator with XRE-family HTH domain
MYASEGERHAEILHEFGRRLTAARIAAGYTSGQLFAFAFGVEPHTYRTWERGEHAPDIKTLQRLCLVLHVSANDLLPVHAHEEQQ